MDCYMFSNDFQCSNVSNVFMVPMFSSTPFSFGEFGIGDADQLPVLVPAQLMFKYVDTCERNHCISRNGASFSIFIPIL